MITSLEGLDIRRISLKYNKYQLDIINSSLSLVDGVLIHLKNSSFTDLWVVHNGPLIAYKISDLTSELYPSVAYKDMCISDKNVSGLSKKEKDALLKMKYEVFDTKKRKVKEVKSVEEEVKEVITSISLEEELAICLENEDYERASIIRDKMKK